MGFFNNLSEDTKGTPENGLDWTDLTELKQLDDIVSLSGEVPVIIFKHSTRCAISRMSLRNLEREYDISEKTAKPYFLDLLKHREISSAITEKFGVWHESPQLILIKNGKAVYHVSHGEISAEAVAEKIEGL